MEVRAMRKRTSLWVPMLALALLATMLGACTTARTVPPAAPQGAARAITVVGSGRASLPPDLVWVNVGVDITAGTVSEAKAQADQRIEAVIAALKEMDIAEEDVQTAQYSINYEREPFFVERGATPEEGQGLYRVSTMLRVTVRNIDQVGEVLDAAVEAGANQMYGASFSVAEPERWEAEAREKAMADARVRADDLARLGGVELGEILSISEVVGTVPVAVREAALAGLGGAGIAPGELEFSTQLQVSFAIQ